MEIVRREIPEAAHERIRAYQAQIGKLETLLQQYVDGVLVGMGIDLTQDVKVDMDELEVLVAPAAPQDTEGRAAGAADSPAS